MCSAIEPGRYSAKRAGPAAHASCALQTARVYASWSLSLPRAGAKAGVALPRLNLTGGSRGEGRRRTVSRMSRKFKKKHARYERPHIITPNLRPIGTVVCSRAAPLAAHHCLCASAANRKKRAHHSAKTCDVAEAKGAERRKFSPDPHRPTRRARCMHSSRSRVHAATS